MQTADFEGIAMVVAAFFMGATVLVPVLALSARFALKPVMDAYAKMRSMPTSEEEKIMQDRRIALLEAEIGHLQQLVQQQMEVQQFDRSLTPKSELPPE